MITKFSVTNFKGFEKEFAMNFSETNGYNFNKECIKNGIVNNAIIYGKNGVGKSNLGLAIFDIISHLTDKQTQPPLYENYSNAFNKSENVKFRYEFTFESQTLVYEYIKTDFQTIKFEELSINNNILALIERGEVLINFKGAENLKKDIPKNLSLLKYIKNNTILDDNIENKTFQDFYNFVEKMLFFRTLEDRIYLGFEAGRHVMSKDIIDRGNVKDLENFLNVAGIDCELSVINTSEKKLIGMKFGDKEIELISIASQGTRALIMFYFWLQRIKEESEVKFLFIDEFDAFYHHELSNLIVQKLKGTGVQFILTTHNTSIMNNDLLRPDCYFIMNKKEIKSFSKSNKKELREAHNIEKMYKAGLFNV